MKEEIEKAAEDYISEIKDLRDAQTLKVGFIAGAESRQREIDELVKVLKEMRWILSSYSSPYVVGLDDKAKNLIKKYKNK